MTILAFEAMTAGLVLSTALVVVTWAFRARGSWALVAAGIAGIALAGAILVRGWRRLTLGEVAVEIERRDPSLANLLVTTVQLGERSRPVHAVIVNELRRQTEARVQSVAAEIVAPIGRAATFAIAVALGAALAWSGVAKSSIDNATATGASGAAVSSNPQQPTVTIIVTPPSYTSLPTTTIRDGTSASDDTATDRDDSTTVRNGRSSAFARSASADRRSLGGGWSDRPADAANRIEVLEGSRIRIEVSPAMADVQLVEAGGAPIVFERSGDVRWLERTAERTQFLLLRFGDSTIPDRLLAMVVTPDAAPIVRIRQPARDLAFPEPRGRVKVEIEATDDLAVSALALRYTRVLGSGESVTFQEGDLPLRVERVQRGQWQAWSEISLEELQLADGDTLVYRAITRDSRPGRDPSSSEAYLLEIGKLAEAASAGFALPEDKDRQAISQQMVIVKTERLHAERDRLPRAEFEERARMLAVEQRMVRAEFVFMTGGEVEDEIAEAEHSHELAEGRFENEGQVELLTAIREMSRAESRLNDAATEPALAFERAALKALQRAFDRRRYLLRTTPERARIDQARRLTGAQTDARSWRRPSPTTQDSGDVTLLEALARDLAAAMHSTANLGPLAARVGSIDPGAPEMQKAALRLSAASGAEADRTAAIAEALQLLAERARKALSPTRGWMPHDPAIGHYSDALAQRNDKR